MNQATYNVLFLCTGNSARSILAEGLLDKLGGGRFKGYSAGSHPTGVIDPLALDTLTDLGCETAALYSKSWDVFAAPDAPRMDFIITVCDSAAGEACPLWPGRPVTAHWGFPDPAKAEGDAAERRSVFSKTAQAVAHRIRLFLSLPLEKLGRLSLQDETKAIGSACPYMPCPGTSAEGGRYSGARSSPPSAWS